MTYLLDTNAVIAVLNKKPETVRERLRQVLTAESRVAISSVVLFELAYSVAKSLHRDANTQRLRTFLAGQVDVISLGPEGAWRAGELRASLERQGTPIGPYDVLIAAQALQLDATLVTANFAEFGRVQGLKWEDWSQS